MAGVTDLPFRKLCRRLGAGLAVGEMITADTKLWNSRKSQFRKVHVEEEAPRAIQIAGGDAEMLAHAAALNEQAGAQIIDINMGCPAKKVCNKAAGSALLKDEKLVAEILEAVTSSVSIPVTLKIRTGWDEFNKNAPTVARIAEQSGIKALTIHGRTRADKFKGQAEYDTIAHVKQAISIPVIANGDINSAQKAKEVLDHTQVDGLMFGRVAQGNPWIFREVDHFLKTGQLLGAPKLEEVRTVILHHLTELHDFYGDYLGVRIARKHIGWYLQAQQIDNTKIRQEFNRLDLPHQQHDLLHRYFESLQLAKEQAA